MPPERDLVWDGCLNVRELGGHPTDPRNLWPEPRPHAEEVDTVENDLNRLVCSGKITLAEARRRESSLKHRSG